MKLNTLGPEEAICNICGIFSRMTKDHIPPKGVPLVGQAYLERLTDTLGADRSARSPKLFQRGIHYRTICEICNSKILGSEYDPVLVNFCKELHSALGKKVHLPISAPVKINRLIRAFVGHLIAHRLGSHRTGKLYSEITDYFINKTTAFPSNLRAYCWVYPYKSQVIAHGIGSIFDHRQPSSSGVFSLMKFYPLGFLCSINDLPEKEASQLTRIDHLTTNSIDDLADINLNISYIPHGRWPEAPGENGAVFHNASGTSASPVQT